MLKFWKKKTGTADAGPGLGDAAHAATEAKTGHHGEHANPAIAEQAPEDLAASPQTGLDAQASPDLGTPVATADSMLSSSLSDALPDARSAPHAPLEARNASHAIPQPDSLRAAPEPGAKKTWRERLAGSIFNRDIRELLGGNPILDDALLDELETVLIGADVGVAASTALVDSLRRRVARREFADAGALLAALRADLIALLAPVAQPLRIDTAFKPFVVLMVGVNGVGKTTTIGKLARRLQAHGNSVVLAAGDTFRAAAVEQLKTWGDRNRITVISQGSGADSASVIFDALQAARSRQIDVLIADTAGRLHTQTGLMDELSKIRRVLSKIDAAAPHEVLLVIDGTTGQNAVNQTRQFRDAIGVTGLVVTKLDGTAKGGIVFALAKEFALPIRYVGLGETLEDLREFEPTAFVDALLPPSIGRSD